MTTPLPDPQQLLEAFAAFSEASEQLQRRYETLQGHVARLTSELQTVLESVPLAIWVLGKEGSVRFTNQPDGLQGAFLDGPAPWEPGGHAGLRHFRDAQGGERFFEQEERPTAEGRVVTLRDVTEARLRAQQATREERLQAMGLMAAELAHEIRNPLGSLSLFAGMLAQDLAHAPDQLELTHRIQEGVFRLNTLVTNTLTFSRDLHPKPHLVLLHSFWDESWRAAGLQGIAWSNAVEAHDAWKVDSDLLRQVAVNLLQNAGRAMEAVASPQLQLKSVREIIQGQEHLRLILEDNGCGIPQEHLARVFDPFYTTFGGGTGLGLAVCHRILEAHGGLLFLESEPSRGTRVHLRLPAC